MTSMPDPASALNPVPAAMSRAVVGGVDTHTDLHVAAVIDHGETVLATRSFSTTRAGYRVLIRWMRSFGDVRRLGVEGTGSYGAGLTRQLAEAGIEVLEVDRPDRPAQGLTRVPRTTCSDRGCTGSGEAGKHHRPLGEDRL